MHAIHPRSGEFADHEPQTPGDPLAGARRRQSAGSYSPSRARHTPDAHNPRFGAPGTGQRPRNHPGATPRQTAIIAARTPWRAARRLVREEELCAGRGVMTSRGNPWLPLPGNKPDWCCFSSGIPFVFILIVTNYKRLCPFDRLFPKPFHM